MQIQTLFCRCNGRTDNPLDHYETSDCGAAEPGSPQRWPLEWLLTLLDEATADQYHTGNRLTATRLLGCPRETAILDNCAIVYDVRAGHSGFCGTLKHRAMHARSRPGSYPEITIPPFIFGDQLVEGKTDKISGDFKTIRDWKTHSESAQEFKYKRFEKGQLDAEGAAQLNIYRIGVAKSILKIDPALYRPKLLLVHGADVKHDGVAWFEVECPLMSEEQILALRPFDDEEHPGTQPYTVTELMGQHADFRTRLDRIPLNTTAEHRKQEIDKIIADMPMVGRNVWRWRWNKQKRTKEKAACGDRCLKYCAAKFHCFSLEMAKQVPVGLTAPKPPTGIELGFEG